MLLISLMVATALPSAAFAASPSSFHVATFYENDNTSDATNTYESRDVITTLTLFESLNPPFVNPGYSFSGWSTSANGSGVAYANGATYDFTISSIILYAQWKENSVTFYENASGLDTVNAIESGHLVGALTSFSSLSPSFSNPGYAFAGWTINANGSGTSYANSASYDFTSGSVSLYAQWSQIPTFSASFLANGGTGAVATLSGLQGSTITLPTVGNLVYPNFTFGGWNTSSNGSGTTYSPGSSVTLNSSVTLYALWVANVFTVTFDANGGTIVPATVLFAYGSSPMALPTPIYAGHIFVGWFTTAVGGSMVGSSGTSYTPSTSTDLFAQWLSSLIVVSFDPNGATGSAPPLSGLAGSSVSLPAAGSMSLPDYTFSGWNTSANGSGTAYTSGNSLSLVSSLTLYAQWTLNALTVTYNAVGGVVSPSSATFTSPTALTLPNPTFDGHVFTGWFSAASGGTLIGLGGSAYSPVTSVNLYAQWSQSASVTVRFDPNGATGGVASVSGTTGSRVTVPGVIGLVRPGFTLLSWNSLANGTGTSFMSGASMTLGTDLTLFAQWTGHKPAAILGAVGRFAPLTTAVTANLKKKTQRLARTIKSQRYTVVSLYGYSTRTGVVSRNLSISRMRANAVASYLRGRLNALHVKGVTIKTAGEGVVAGASDASNSRVEVMVY